MWLDIVFIVLFIFLNGLFAAAEIAVVAARKSRLKQLAEEGNKAAEILLRFKEEPDRFLATIQIAITLAGVLASAIGGAAAVQVLKPVIAEMPYKPIAASSEAISIGIVALVITYVTLVFGELIPKSIALTHPEGVGLRIAKLVEGFSKVATLFVKVLTLSTNLLLRPFGRKPFTERAYVTEEEVKMLIMEGGEQGVFEPTEQELIHSVFEFTDMSAKEVMVPSTRMVSISLTMSVDEIKSTIAEEQFSRYPVVGKDLNDIRGILYAKDFLNALARGEADVRKLIKPPFFIPETKKISNLLREMQRKRIHMALVIDEYGGVSGLVTMEDLIEEIVGEIRDEYDIESPVIQLSDGTLLIDASISIKDLADDYRIELPESTEYDTLGGFLLATLQRIPRISDVVEIEGKKITVSEMVGQRIAKVKLEKIPVKESEE
ncbi:MAG: hemolysin family protein [Nitrospirae bacterium]|nr:hemolysin family protein [Nitrospirota bacterium]MCL5421171.1 hemolysin family protein [Nitrospirota bacterium]